jgi:hypothetical protein
MKLNPEIFELAAEKIGLDEEFACNAIEKACYDAGVSTHDYVKFFVMTLCPNLERSGGAWYSVDTRVVVHEPTYLTSHENNARVFGLLLCAELIRENRIRAEYNAEIDEGI